MFPTDNKVVMSKKTIKILNALYAYQVDTGSRKWCTYKQLVCTGMYI